MANSNKMTYTQALEAVVARLDEEADVELIEKLTALKDSLNKKRTTKKEKPENAMIRAAVLAVLKNATKPMTITEIIKNDTALMEYSNQKITSIVRGLMDDDLVVGIKDKRKSTFTIANKDSSDTPTEE